MIIVLFPLLSAFCILSYTETVRRLCTQAATKSFIGFFLSFTMFQAFFVPTRSYLHSKSNYSAVTTMAYSVFTRQVPKLLQDIYKKLEAYLENLSCRSESFIGL